MTLLQPAIKTFRTLAFLKKHSTVGIQEKEVSTLKDYADLSPSQIHYISPQRITARWHQQQPASFQPRLKPGHRKDKGIGSTPILHHHSEQFQEDALVHCLKCCFVSPDSQEILLSIIYKMLFDLSPLPSHTPAKFEGHVLVGSQFFFPWLPVKQEELVQCQRIETLLFNPFM